MKMPGFAAVMLATMFAVGAIAAVPTTEDDVDRDFGRQAVAKAVAETLVTDQAYEAFLVGYISSSEMQAYINDEAVKKAVALDKAKVQDAIVDASKQLVSKSLYAEGMATVIAASFTYAELKQILAFVRSDVGKRYSALAYDAHFGEALVTAMYKGKQMPDPRPVLEKELKLRFPSMTFKF